MDGIGKLLQNRRGPGRPEPDSHLHQEMHVLADEISTAFGERKRFGMYLGVIKRVGPTKARAIYRQIVQDGGARQPGRLFMFLCKDKDGDGDHKKGSGSAAPAG